MPSLGRPHCLLRNGNVHLSYELPHRVHETAIYPVRADNGSSIVIYGHSHGLTVFWRGGKPVKIPVPVNRSQVTPTNNPNNAGSAITIVDSDEEDTAQSKEALNRRPTYHSDEDEFDSTQPYEQIVHEVDLDLGTEVLHIAVPPLHPDSTSRPSTSIPTIFYVKVVVAITCSDSSVKILELPLAPTHASVQSAEVLTLTPSLQMKQPIPPQGIALSWNLKHTLNDNPDPEDFNLVVAVHSIIGSGLLSIWRVQFEESPRFAISKNPSDRTLRTRCLSSPTTGVSFNPYNAASQRHNHLLIVEQSGVVRIYDYAASKSGSSLRSTEDLANSAERQRQLDGAWLLSLYGPMRETSDFPQRKRIIDAQWACNGKCIIVLLEDGEWGLWDIECVDPRLQGSNFSSTLTVNGSGITPFALHGFLSEATAAGKAKLQPGGGSASKQVEKLAPMTPKTRKSKQTNLFSGSKPIVSASALALGGISVLTTDALDIEEPEESVLLWYEETVFVIPGLMDCWRQGMAASPKNDAGTIAAPSAHKISSLSTGGENITSIAQFSPRTRSRSKPSPSARLGQATLVAAEHRLIIISPEQKSPESIKLPERSTHQRNPSQADQDLLSRGDLDLGGVDRMLNGLSKSDHAPSISKGSNTGEPGRRVGFARDF